MVTYILIIIGAVFALIGIFLFMKGIGAKTASKVKFLGLEVETRSSSLIIFLVGAALIAFGATSSNNNSNSTNNDDTNNTIKEKAANANDDQHTASSETGSTSTGNVSQPSNENAAPFKEFTLTAGQQQVMNDLKITFTLENQRWSAETNAVTIRIWRNITQPLSDTAYLDPSGGQPGTVNQLFKIDHITPISIPDVGQYKIIVSNPIIANRYVVSAQVKMFRN